MDPESNNVTILRSSEMMCVVAVPAVDQDTNNDISKQGEVKKRTISL
jgi:hypothetical protein